MDAFTCLRAFIEGGKEKPNASTSVETMLCLTSFNKVIDISFSDRYVY